MSLPVQIQILVGGQLRGHVVLDGSRKVNKIGRTPTSQIKLDDQGASRVHAVIEVTRTGSSLIDMGSANGTLLNGTRVAKAQLNHGDQIIIGSTMLVVSLGAELAVTAGLPSIGPVLAAPPNAATLPTMPISQPATQPPGLPIGQRGPPPMTFGMPGAVPPTVDAAPPAQTSTVPRAFAPPEPVVNTYRDSGSFSDTDPAIMRIQQQARRNRLIGYGVIIGIAMIVVVLLVLKPGIEVQQVPEAERYSNFGADKKPSAAAADQSVPVPGDPALAADVPPTGAAAAGTPPTEAPTSGTTAAGTPTESKTAFATTEPRDEARFLYRKLEAERTLAQVVVEVYGNSDALEWAVKANPLVEAEQSLKPGTELRLPRFAEYEVKPGDTLGGIAAARLGDGKRYPEILAANKDSLASPDDLKVGSRLRLPLLP